MRNIITLFLILITLSESYSQVQPAARRTYQERYPEGPILNQQDSLFLMNLPEKKLPAQLRAMPLPPVVDNSDLPYLRPVFEQVAPSCGQAAMIGYNFTYEMACLRDQPALFPQTQYPTHFAYNFQNGGNGWYGVSYFHSIEILRLNGTMNSFDYGGFYDDGIRWINGYDLYYNGMFNRVKGVCSIKTGTEEGINALKHWLYNHMGEQTHGGVASYYANTPWNATFLNDTTPEGGKFVVTNWFPYASHAMTIIGYNDSIRFDYNADGQYTNTIDLDGDGIITPCDWEIGGVKFVNSHGVGAQDSGFCYMMYKCLAEKFENGGVWNREVHILEPDPYYQPLMTYKVTLKHDKRQMVKILAGISADTSDLTPEYIMDFPIIDYQGDNRFMQGPDTSETLKSLEFGLDITPLLSYAQPGEPAKFFFMVDENDPPDEGDGQISSFSLMDYTDDQLEVVCSQTPLPLENNSRNIVSVIHYPEFEKVNISTETLPIYTVNQPYSFQLVATGGSQPYSWAPVFNYRMEQSQEDFPGFHDSIILDNATFDTIMPVSLGFAFPYYGKVYDTVFMHINGHLQFDNAQLPWPYMMEPVLHFRSNRIIAPMTNMQFTITPADGDGGWAELTDTTATFRWKLSYTENPATSEFNFAVRLHSDGTIDFLYGESTLNGIPWLGGISAGNKTDYIMVPFSGAEHTTQGQKITWFPNFLPEGFDLTESGLLTCMSVSDEQIYDLSFRVTDNSGISAAKTLQFSSGPYLNFIIVAGDDDKIDYGDSVVVSLETVNASQEPITNPTIELISNDFFVDISDFSCETGTISPGEASVIEDAFVFTVSAYVPDLRDLLLQAIMTSGENTWNKELVMKAHAPDVRLHQYFVDDEDGRLDPGETRDFLITLLNNGHATISEVAAELIPLDPGVEIVDEPVQDFGSIIKGASVSRPYLLRAEESVPNGTEVAFLLEISSLEGLTWQDTIQLRIGKTPVLLADMDPNFHSGPLIRSMLEELGIIYEYDYIIPAHMKNFQSVFVCLGFHNSNHILTLGEGTRLAQYLVGGGRLYMEGRKTWRDDPGTPIQPYFSLNAVSTVGVFDTLTGINETFTSGLSFLNEASTPFSFYYLDPAGEAFSILEDNSTGFPCAIAYDDGNYRTIGALFELGTMSGIDPVKTTDLLTEYLEFFGVDVVPVGIDENLGMETWGHGGLDVWPNPAVGQITVGGRRSAVGGQQSAVGGRRSVVNLTIFNSCGKIMAEFEKIDSLPFSIDVSSFPAGIYLVRLSDESGLRFKTKIIKVSR